MEQFLTVANVRFIEKQMWKVLKAKASSQDAAVLDAVKGIAVSEIEQQLTMPQMELLKAFEQIEDRVGAELFIESLKRYTIPFQPISPKQLQSLFKKEKKLHIPNLASQDWTAISYLSWYDSRTHRQYIVTEREGNYTALRGVAEPQYRTKGICAICHEQTDVHLFTAKVKGKEDQFTAYSNYICDNVQTCNQRLSDYEKLETFVQRNLI
ncbi:FusB/FusC family EF-G-binding protein [Kurthia senegalensis]|uniref:FusB/FusC family EF-G-binding protein n=1 Tax=Kurthia senegalensis TaxID=1033740 RepID=UPI0002880930|nr:elongation factor G-binding protein [Kurthia senegalensis]